MLNLVHLKVLAAVAQHGSVTEAAKELHYSQPSVSHHLSRLEAATGVKLVQRVGRGIRLTPEGRAAGQPGHRDRGTGRRGHQRAGRAGRPAGRAGPPGRQRVRTEHHRARRRPPPWTEAHPGLELSLIDRHPVEALQMLRQGEIDVALVFRYAHAPRGGRRDSASSTSATTRSTSSAGDPTTASRTIATPPGSAVANGARAS